MTLPPNLGPSRHQYAAGQSIETNLFGIHAPSKSQSLTYSFAWAYFSNGSFIGRAFVKPFAVCYQTVICLSCPVCNVGVLWPNGWIDQDETWHGGIDVSLGHIVLDGDPALRPPK